MGKESKIGDTRTSANGYHYTKTEDGWRLTHHLIAEGEILGRRLKRNERVYFKDNDRTNLDPDNIQVKKTVNRREKRIHDLTQRIQRDQEELAELLKEERE